MWECGDRWWREKGGGMGELSAGVQVAASGREQRRSREGGWRERRHSRPGPVAGPAQAPKPRTNTCTRVCWCAASLMCCQTTQCLWAVTHSLHLLHKGRRKCSVTTTEHCLSHSGLFQDVNSQLQMPACMSVVCVCGKPHLKADENRLSSPSPKQT